ncbi:MAG TPA: hypothetical protein VGA92_01955 [Candidatus Nitrosotenuis sp.]
MNKTLKYAGLLAILPLFTASLTTIAFENPSAEGQRVCGDKICTSQNGPDAEKEREKMRQEIAGKTTTSETSQKEETKTFEESDLGSVLRLSRANVPATIPMHEGFYNGEAVYFIITDSSDKTHADTITKNQGWKVELAPPLANAPKEALSKTYMFTNGVNGNGVHGFQGEVFTSTPAQPEIYSALTSHVHVTWNEGTTPKVLDSEQAILDAQSVGEVSLQDLKVVINMPQIVWPGGQMMVKEDKTLSDETPYGGGQVLDIDLDKMTVTFIAHRGWGPDGRTIYYIVTDATPEMPANMMGVASAPTSAKLIANSAAVDLFQFMNGITGSGPMGFQAGIAVSAPGDQNYSPMWRISVIGWKDPTSAKLLETTTDISAFTKAGLIDVGLAGPMVGGDHIVNCPFIDPFQ